MSCESKGIKHDKTRQIVPTMYIESKRPEKQLAGGNMRKAIADIYHRIQVLAITQAGCLVFWIIDLNAKTLAGGG